MKKVQAFIKKHPIKKIKDERKRAYLYTLLLSLAIYAVIVLLMGVTPFGERSLCINDGMFEYMPFASDFVDNLIHGSFFYSFHGALGYNMFGTALYYLSGPWSLFFILFGKNNVTITMQLIIIAKAVLLGLSMTYFFMTREKRDIRLAVVLSVIYEFSYYVIAYQYNMMWFDPIILLPFIVVGLERLDSHRGRMQYVVSLTVAMICNYYMAALLCVFIAFYYIFIIADYRHFKHLLKQTGIFAFCSILSALMAGVILIPAALDIIQMHASRLEKPEITFFHDILFAIEKHLPFSSIETVVFDDGELNVYCGIGVFFASLNYLINTKALWRKRIGYILFMGLLLVSFEFSPLNYMFHGFYQQCGIPNRYAFGYIFMIFTLAYEGLTNMRSQKTLITMVVALLMIGGSAYLLSTSQGADVIRSDVLDFFDLSHHQAVLFTFGYIVVFVILYMLAFILKKRWCMTLIMLAFMLETAMSAAHVEAHTYLDSYQYRRLFTEAVNQVHEKDPRFYRESIIVDDSFENVHLYYNINGVPTFNSIINTHTLDFLGRLGMAKGDNYLRYDGHTPVTDMLFGVKYIYSREYEDFGPAYEEYAEEGDVIIYKNRYTLPIGFRLDTSHLRANYTNKFDNNIDLFEMYGDLFDKIPIRTSYDEELKVRKEDNSNFRVDSKDGKTVTFTIEGINTSEAYIYTRSWNVSSNRVMVNDDERSDINASGYITYLGDVTDEDVVTVSFTYNETEEDVEVLLFAAALNYDVLEDIYHDLKEHSVYDVEQHGSGLTMKYTADEDQDLMFTLPYDPSWQVSVDHQREKLLSIHEDAFIGVHVKKGEHEIKLTYVPRGFVMGAGLSAAGLFILLIYLQISKRLKKAHQNP